MTGISISSSSWYSWNPYLLWRHCFFWVFFFFFFGGGGGGGGYRTDFQATNINCLVRFHLNVFVYFLSGEIGGFLGLLLGASVMTLAEVLDLVLYRLIPWDTHCYWAWMWWPWRGSWTLSFTDGFLGILIVIGRECDDLGGGPGPCPLQIYSSR